MRRVKDLVHPHALFKLLCKCKLRTTYVSDQRPEMSVVLTFHNQWSLIAETIKGIVDSVSNLFELIVINDCSNKQDSSKKSFDEIINALEIPDKLVKVTYLQTCTQKFETFCDNLGATIAVGKFLCFVQSDMVIQDKAFDIRALGLLKDYQHLGAISGHSVSVNSEYARDKWMKKSGHAFSLPPIRLVPILRRLLSPSGKNYQKDFVGKKTSTQDLVCVEDFVDTESLFTEFLRVGKADYVDTRHGLPSQIQGATFCLSGRLINRGPILIAREDYIASGGFDPKYFFQGFDDLNLCISLLDRGKVVGFSPINYVSKEDWSTTRQKKTWSTIAKIRLLQLVRMFRRQAAPIWLKGSKNIHHDLVGKILLPRHD